MATTNYILHILSANAKFIITYKNAKFHKLTHQSGSFKNEKHFDSLMKIVPQFETEIDLYATQFETKVSYTAQTNEKPQTLFSKILDAYFTFYVKKTGLEPRMNATEGKALKQIISHLKKICATDTETLETWQAVLTNWKQIDKFYQDQLELRQINSNINIILRQIKNGNSNTGAKRTANNNADDLRKSI